MNSNSDFERLCSLDVLGLTDTPAGDQFDVYDEFKEQLTRSPEGWYELSLPWKGNCPALPNNRDGSMRQLNSLLRKLSRRNMLDDYDEVIREQLAGGVVERAPTKAPGGEFYCHIVQLSVRVQKQQSFESCMMRLREITKRPHL